MAKAAKRTKKYIVKGHLKNEMIRRKVNRNLNLYRSIKNNNFKKNPGKINHIKSKLVNKKLKKDYSNNTVKFEKGTKIDFSKLNIGEYTLENYLNVGKQNLASVFQKKNEILEIPSASVIIVFRIG